MRKWIIVNKKTKKMHVDVDAIILYDTKLDAEYGRYMLFSEKEIDKYKSIRVNLSYREAR